MPFPQTTVSQSPSGPIAGSLVNTCHNEINTFLQEEASAEIPFGVMVKQGTADRGCLKLTATSNKLVGIVVHSHAYDPTTQLGTTGLKPKQAVSVLQRGRCYVLVEEAVTPASAVKVRAVVAGAEVAGAFRDTADSTDCIDISSFARYRSSAGAGELAELEIDMTGRNDAVADT